MLLSIAVPCYNEEANIPKLVNNLASVETALKKKKHKIELIFVDDGSKDNTYSLLKKHYGKRKYVKVIKHKVNKNLGGALKTAFSNVSGDVVATVDADCTYDPKEITSMLKLLTSEVDLVVASPYHPKGEVVGVPANRLILSRGASLLYALASGSKLYTYTSMFRICKKHVVDNVRFKSNGFLAIGEFTLLSLIHGYTVKEYPTTLRTRTGGVSSIKWFSFKNYKKTMFYLALEHLNFMSYIFLKRLTWKKRK
jgi:dolichol-phosphate mannosyltransferase